MEIISHEIGRIQGCMAVDKEHDEFQLLTPNPELWKALSVLLTMLICNVWAMLGKSILFLL